MLDELDRRSVLVAVDHVPLQAVDQVLWLDAIFHQRPIFPPGAALPSLGAWHRPVMPPVLKNLIDIDPWNRRDQRELINSFRKGL